jgi:EAL domain-containing protein (putative c-di-GMP-specific phosphodiesterase class I)
VDAWQNRRKNCQTTSPATCDGTAGDWATTAAAAWKTEYNKVLDLDDAVTGRGIEATFQPIVSIEDQYTVGFEALTRWPALQAPQPDAVFARARQIGAIDRLNRLCVQSAISAALDDDVDSGLALLINCEPGCMLPRRVDDVTLARGSAEFQLVFELTERDLLADPAALLRQVSALREDGFRIALDDVGAVPRALSALDIVAPDLVKFDISVVQSQLQARHTHAIAAVLAYRERSNAIILAEGIENDAHLEQAIAIGATIGQGFRFGAPGSASPLRQRHWTIPAVSAPVLDDHRSPFALAQAHGAVHVGRKPTLLALSRNIETQAVRTGDSPLVLTAIQHSRHYTPATRARYRELAESSPVVAIFGEHLPEDVGPGVRGVELDPDDPLCSEWVVLALGPLTATALIGRDAEPGSTAPDRRFDFAITHDRALVTAVAQNMLARMPGPPG